MKPTPSPRPPAVSAGVNDEGLDAAGEYEPLDFLGPPQAADEIGRLGHYAVLKELGRGGMGVVLLAEDTHLQRKVALKVMLPSVAKDPKARERFLREARAAAKIRHDNVVIIYQVGEEQGVPFIAMELLPGVSLAQRLAENGALSLAEALRIGRDVALGLQAAHQEGLVHRDIKPANIWLEPGAADGEVGRVKLLDFGLARPQGPTRLTQRGAVLGTPAFMSPEQAKGLALDQRSDLFSLGVILYVLCTGTQPFDGPSVMAVLTALAVEKPRPVRAVNPQAPAQVEKVIDRLLEKKVGDRYQSCAEVIADLNAALHGLQAGPQGSLAWQSDRTETLAAPSKLGHAAPHHSRRRPLLIVLSVAAIMVCLGVAAFFLLRDGRQPDPIRDDKSGAVEGEPKEITNSIGMALVRIEPGKFWMGSPKTEPGRANEEVLHEVEISRPFYIGKHEVTQEQYGAVTGHNPSTYGPGGAKGKAAGKDTRRFPVDSVSWEKAKEFCALLSAKEGKEYRLPTEAEWEYCCRAGTKTPFSFGASITSKEVNFDQHHGGPLPVGSFPANAWGLHDMHGNVREWCQDFFDLNYYKSSPTKDPSGPADGELRVLRGANWYNGISGCRSAFRDKATSGSSDSAFAWCGRRERDAVGRDYELTAPAHH